MISIGKQNNKTDAWVKLCGGIFRWHTGGKVSYKRVVNHLVGDLDFIARREFVHRGAEISWWGWEAVYRCHF